MSTPDAKQAAAQWITEHKLPEDLSGQAVNLVTFASDEDCLFFYPHRFLVWQQKVNKFVARQCAKRGAKIEKITVTPETYRAWLEGVKAPDVGFRRRAYVESLQGLAKPGHSGS